MVSVFTRETAKFRQGENFGNETTDEEIRGSLHIWRSVGLARDILANGSAHFDGYWPHFRTPFRVRGLGLAS